MISDSSRAIIQQLLRTRLDHLQDEARTAVNTGKWTALQGLAVAGAAVQHALDEVLPSKAECGPAGRTRIVI